MLSRRLPQIQKRLGVRHASGKEVIFGSDARCVIVIGVLGGRSPRGKGKSERGSATRITYEVGGVLWTAPAFLGTPFSSFDKKDVLDARGHYPTSA